MTYWRRHLLLAALGVLLLLLPAAAAHAQTSSSSYKIEEGHFGIGGEVDATSASYRANSSAGTMGSGISESTSFTAWLGFQTPDQPMLEIFVQNSSLALGVISPATTGAGAATIRVRTYISTGYVLQITGSAPSISGHTIAALATPTASSAGTEQFGVNLRDNTTPNIGADAAQVPDSTFSFGAATADYNTPDLFKYVSGDTIAQSAKATGETNYTMSVIMNVSKLTPAGQYSADLSAIATSTF